MPIYDLTPVHDLVIISSSEKSTHYRSIGNDPHFEIPLPNILRKGLYEIKISVKMITGELIKPRLYIDTGKGYNENEAIALPPLIKNEIKWILNFTSEITHIRFDPSVGIGEFSINEFTLISLSDSEIKDLEIKLHNKNYTIRNNYFKFDYLNKFLCLEISPLSRPLIAPKHPNSRFLDICSTEELKKKYSDDPDVNKNEIVQIHYVHKNQSYKELVGDDKFGLIIASHVIEHVPNLVGWFQDIESVLLDDGLLQLAVPDKRFCFDFRRRLSNISDIMGAYIENRKKPSATSVYDHSMFAQNELCNDPILHHSGRSPVDFKQTKEYHQSALKIAQQSINEYVDVHCWQFIPETFTTLFNFLYERKLIRLKLLEKETRLTQQNEHEFFVTFKKQK